MEKLVCVSINRTVEKCKDYAYIPEFDTSWAIGNLENCPNYKIKAVIHIPPRMNLKRFAHVAT